LALRPPDKLRLVRVYERLGRAYGKRRRTRSGTLLEQLILTILSSEAKEHEAFRALSFMQREYVDWNEVRICGEDHLREKLHRVGVNSGVPRLLKQSLEGVLHEAATLRPEVLDTYTPQQIDGMLGKIRFPKSLSASLLLLGKPRWSEFDGVEVPIDESVARVMARIGFVKTARATDQIMHCIRTMLPPEEEHNVHRVVAKLAREHCTDSAPQCGRCPVREECRHGKLAAVKVPGTLRNAGKLKVPGTLTHAASKAAPQYRQTGAARSSRPPSPAARPFGAAGRGGPCRRKLAH